MFVRTAGVGPAVLWLHGHPRTSGTWHRVAPRLVDAGFTVVCPDLRGYGRSSGPPPSADHSAHSKRAMAGDMFEVTTQWWHWFFFAQPDTPERVINADPDAWYHGDPAVMGPENHAEWRAATRNPAVVQAPA